MDTNSYTGSQEKNVACEVSFFFEENQFLALPAAARMKSHTQHRHCHCRFSCISFLSGCNI